MQLDEPAECASGGVPVLLYKILHLLFYPPIQILCALCLESRKNYQHGLDVGPLEFISSAEDVSPTHSEHCCFVSGSSTKHQVSSPIIILLQKILCASAIMMMSWQDVTLSSLCSGVKEWNKTCTQVSLSQILFQNPKNYSNGDVQRFCYHS